MIRGVRTGSRRAAPRPRRRLWSIVAASASLVCLALLAATAGAATFSNATPVPIADGSGAIPPFTAGLGSPYPSTIVASGLVGTVTKVTVSLHGVSHANPDDLDIMLVGPQGQRVVILSDSGESTALSGAELGFDDDAADFAPDTTGLTPGATYKPTNNFGGLGEPTDGNDVFPPPAPGPPRAASFAAAFNGTDGNGTWSLYALDDRPSATGTLGAGWTLNVTSALPPAVPPPLVPPPALPPPLVPPPVLGKAVNVAPVSGKVFVSVPAGGAFASLAVPGIKGRRFVPLTAARQLPVGSYLDTRKGSVSLTSAAAKKGQLFTGIFSAGVFQALQLRSGLTDLPLKGASFRSCARAAGSKASAALSRRAIRRMRANARGRFRTRGRYSAATVRGTIWNTIDRCDGTLTKVKRGVVVVRDFRKHRNITVRAGKSYLARAPG
jgi:subtilisin-like proprotein convertase family protein